MKKSIIAFMATLCLILAIRPQALTQIIKSKTAFNPTYEKMRLTLPFDTEEREYMVQKIDHYYVLNGDIIVGDDLQRTRLNQKVPPAIPGVPSSIYLWPNGQLPIVVDPNVYEYGMEGTVRAAVAEFNNKVSNLCLVSRTNEKDYVRIQISSNLGSAGGVSAVGRQGGEQVVLIAENQPPSVIIHELLHALGFYHEQSRTDRGNFVDIVGANVEAGKIHNFQIEWGSQGRGAYDFCSIMHYPADAFGDGKTTIACKQNGNAMPCPGCMGNGSGLSAGDIQGINEAYNFSQKLLPCGTALAMEPRWHNLGGKAFSNQEAVAYGKNKLAIFTFGTDGEVYCNRWDGSKWTDWQKTGWGNAPTKSQIKAVSWGNGRLDAFVVGGNKQLYHAWWEGSKWSAWEPLGGNLTGEFDVVSWSAGRLDIFARDVAGGLSHLYFDNGWSTWESPLSGGIREGSSVEVVSWAPQRLDIFVVKNDKSVHHLWFDKGWGEWEPLGGGMASQMTVASFGIGHIDIFGEGNDGAVWHKYYDVSKWSDWHSLGGKVVPNSGMEAVAWGGNRLDLFVKGLDNALYHAWWGGGNKWSDFERLGGRMMNNPTVATWGQNRLDVFATGEDNSIRQMFWDGAKWGM